MVVLGGLEPVRLSSRGGGSRIEDRPEALEVQRWGESKEKRAEFSSLVGPSRGAMIPDLSVPLIA